MTCLTRHLLALTALAVLAGVSVGAQADAPGRRPAPGPVSSATPPALQKVRFDQKLDAQLPLDAVFKDDEGRTVPLGTFFGKRPVVLAFVYYECPMLCTQVLNGAVAAFKVLNFNIGDEYEVVTLSFNPKETPAMASAKKETYLARYGRPAGAKGWHFLTGEQPAIGALASSVGFRYVFDQASQQYVHASAIMVLTPDGRVSKYFYGIDYPPKDLRLGLIEASGGRIGTPVDQVLLYCYHYDPHSGKYSMVVMNVLRVAGVLTVALIGGFIVTMWGLDRRKSKRTAAMAPPAPQS